MLAAMLGMGLSAFVSPNVGQAIPIRRTAGSPVRRGVFSRASLGPALVGTRSARGSVARDKRAAVKTKNRRANRRNHG